MTFKIIVSVLLIGSAFFNLGLVDQKRKPISAGTAILSLIINGVIVYGLWRWI